MLQRNKIECVLPFRTVRNHEIGCVLSNCTVRNHEIRCVLSNCTVQSDEIGVGENLRLTPNFNYVMKPVDPKGKDISYLLISDRV